MKTYKRAAVHISSGLLAAVMGCSNEAQFRNGSADYSEDVVGEPVISEPAEFALTWNLECQKPLNLLDGKGSQGKPSANVGDKGAAQSKKAAISGQGDHEVDLNDNDDLTLSIQGTLCSPESQSREIVFVIDVSGSMADNDPLVAGTCGRAQAVAAIVNSVSQAANTRIGLVTFGTGVARSTGALVDHQTFVQSTYFTEAVLCEAVGNTNYQAALAQSIAMLTAARPDSVREVYFISDGFPTGGQNGFTEAATLKDPMGINATIATLMLTGNDAALKSIASTDSNGLPRHAKTDEASQLAEIIKDLSQSEVVHAVLRYREIGTSEWTEMDLEAHIKDRNYVVKLNSVQLIDYPNGLEVELEFIDTRGQSTFNSGRLVWNAQTAAAAD